MGPRGKILASFLLIIVVIIAVWQFTTPVLIPPVGTKYLSSTQYANRGSWVVLEVSGFGKPPAPVHHKLPALRDSLHRIAHRPLYNPVIQHHAECRLNNFPIAKGLFNSARVSSHLLNLGNNLRLYR